MVKMTAKGYKAKSAEGRPAWSTLWKLTRQPPGVLCGVSQGRPFIATTHANCCLPGELIGGPAQGFYWGLAT